MTKGRVLLAYSGGLDTSCILVWLIEQGYEVLAYLANVGQDEDFDAAREKALKIGASKVFIEDLRSVFIDEFIFPAIQANAVYENIYLLGTSLARPPIARRHIELAIQEGCQYVSHGCTGKGNDQVRFELGYYALNPDIKVIAPWRMPEFYEKFPGRQALLAYAAKKNIPVVQTAAKSYSEDGNLYHISHESGLLEDPGCTPPKDMWSMTVDPEEAPNTPEHIKCNSLDLFTYLNKLAGNHGIGRVDMVESRFIGLKSRGCYESPAATVLRVAHLDLEGITLDGQVRHLKEVNLSIPYGRVLYNGLYFSPEREFLSHSLEFTQRNVNGEVKIKLYKGNVIIEGRKAYGVGSKLYDMRESSMDEHGGLTPTDAGGFINTHAIRLRKWVPADKQ
ncbi:3948_t:CDS:2 [Entrophospora sp. SA101]|nr:2503_t:CDS:2 [Entrophospora sp. SA101]CAJ0643900.1 3948_t:CDS:2 [Entrophospora sp. SA101]CAJ0830098.1 5999_t:CDS:2 [Entrophospora sp. SA101]CAJ0846440.1 9675_t:CDS:2 [Entrophospora sp. SA101]